MNTWDTYLDRCVELAEEALEAGDEPFGSVLVAGDGAILAEDRNRETSTDDPLAHPEIALARWAVRHLTPDERTVATVVTSGEHCAMCSAGHGWSGLGRIVYAHSSGQLVQWHADFGVPAGRLAVLSIQDVVPGLPVEGPVPGYDERMREIHRRWAAARD